MKEDILLQLFAQQTCGEHYYNGQRLINNDLVSSIELDSEGAELVIKGHVISESLFNEYHTTILFDTTELAIQATHCSCSNFEANSTNRKNYCCKHLVATFYKATEELCIHPSLQNIKDEASLPISGNVLALLVPEEDAFDQLKIEVLINRNSWSQQLNVEFRIGLSSMSSTDLYTLKDIPQFLSALRDSLPLEYGRNFRFHIKRMQISLKDKQLIEFLQTVQSIDDENQPKRRLGDRYIGGKYLTLPDYLVRTFFETVQAHKVYLNEGFFSRPVLTEILSGSPPLDFDLKLIKDSYVLKSLEGMPDSLSTKADVLLYGTSIYLPDYGYSAKLRPYLQVFTRARVVSIPAVQEEKVLRKLIPDLRLLAPTVALSKAIQDKTVLSDVTFKFYFDMDDDKTTLITKVVYGHYEFNIFEDLVEKVVYRDLKQEQLVLATLQKLGFAAHRNHFVFQRNEEFIFQFFKHDIARLQQLGEVFYSERFKGIRRISGKSISAGVGPGKYAYFEMNFKLPNISRQETVRILRAFRNNLKYYRLKTGDFLDLEELELKQFLRLMEVVAPEVYDGNPLIIPYNKAPYLSDYIKTNGLRFIKGAEELDKISKKLKQLDSRKFLVPKNLNAVLYDYQKLGYQWLRTLHELGFGGILGDEMGLGKTVQAISFVQACNKEKSLIITPTSLLYNWMAEFQRFAPGLRVKGIYGDPAQREESLQNLEDCDVLITTYHLLKRDIEIYQKLEFGCCILDEAQYIKNPHSQNAIAAKLVNARTRFALTGTPMENSLMELWSIFDFIMPGYLYDEKRFSTRYHKRLNEEPEVLEEVSRLARPFILRRTKQQVLAELPDKIVKQLVVVLNDQQKRVYQTYARHAADLIEKKVSDSEFETSKIEILAFITKLRQLCLDPSVVLDHYEGGNEKLEALVELLHEAVEEGHKILVFSQFTTVLRNIETRLHKEAITCSYLDGTIKAEDRLQLVNTFNEDDTSVFLISLKAGGTGLNLTSADVVIHFDPWWNPAVENQATDRAHRIGQQNVVEVIRIIAQGTIEEKILSLQEEKKKLIFQLLQGKLETAFDLSSLTAEQLLSLLQESPRP